MFKHSSEILDSRNPQKRRHVRVRRNQLMRTLLIPLLQFNGAFKGRQYVTPLCLTLSFVTSHVTKAAQLANAVMKSYFN